MRPSSLLEQGRALETALMRETRAVGTAQRPKNVWQRAGVQSGESEIEISSRVRSAELEAVRGSLRVLEAYQPSNALTSLEQYTPYISMATAATLGALYGGARGYFRGWSQDVTPSVCRELATHVGARAALGALILVAAFEYAPWLKAQALKLAGESEVTSYSDSNALKQLVAIDCAYLGVIGLVNFAFPFCLVPWACNVAQILVLPSQAPASARRTNPTTTKQ